MTSVSVHLFTVGTEPEKLTSGRPERVDVLSSPRTTGQDDQDMAGLDLWSKGLCRAPSLTPTKLTHPTVLLSGASLPIALLVRPADDGTEV